MTPTSCYGVAVFYIVTVLVRVNVLRNHMNSDRRMAINLGMGLWIIVAAIEYIYPNMMIAGFATAVGVMIIYVKLENPGMYIDRHSGLYNQNAFMEYMKQLVLKQIKFLYKYTLQLLLVPNTKQQKCALHQSAN